MAKLTLVCGAIDGLTRPAQESLSFYYLPETCQSQRAQFELGLDFARLAQTSPVEIWTHSDHIFNGIRVAVKNEVLLPEDIDVLFYPQETDQVCRLQMRKGGRMNSWPDGFFDQWEKALDLLLED